MHAEPTERSAAQQHLLAGIRPGHAADQAAWLQFAQGKGIVRAQGHLLRTHQVHQVLKDHWVVHQGIEPEPAEVILRCNLVVHCAEVRTHLEAMLDARHRGGEGTTAVRESHPQPWQLLEQAAEDHAGDGERGLHGHANQPRHPVLVQAVLAEHVPGMHEHAQAKLLAGLEHGQQARFAEVHALHVRADLDPREPDALDAFQFAHGELGILHGHGAKAHEAFRVGVHDAGDMVVEELRELKGVLRARPVAEHDRHRAQHLHVHAVLVAFRQARGRVPAIGLHLAEELVVHHHPRAAGPVMVQVDEATIAETPPEVRDGLGQDVRVYVDREEPHAHTNRGSVSITCPQRLQVRRSSLP